MQRLSTLTCLAWMAGTFVAAPWLAVADAPPNRVGDETVLQNRAGGVKPAPQPNPAAGENSPPERDAPP
jgi:hypothetical protein